MIVPFCDRNEDLESILRLALGAEGEHSNNL
jgi:hypothetical protein